MIGPSTVLATILLCPRQAQQAASNAKVHVAQVLGTNTSIGEEAGHACDDLITVRSNGIAHFAGGVETWKLSTWTLFGTGVGVSIRLDPPYHVAFLQELFHPRFEGHDHAHRLLDGFVTLLQLRE
jgi:hypothetical protein